MFRVQNTILSEDIATAKFGCDLTRCKGSCCVVGDAGAPISEQELPLIEKAFELLSGELAPEAIEMVEAEGLFTKSDSENKYRLNCVQSGECVFVQYDRRGIATCAIQKAFIDGRLTWEKPLSCHLFPIRLKRRDTIEYANFEYLPDICRAGCQRGKEEGIWLSDFLKAPLIRRYGKSWYQEFLKACNEIRANQETVEVC